MEAVHIGPGDVGVEGCVIAEEVLAYGVGDDFIHVDANTFLHLGLCLHCDDLILCVGVWGRD
jgi:hypothetical protein